MESLPLDLWPAPAAPAAPGGGPLTSTRWAVAWALTEAPTPGPLFVAASHALEKLMEKEGRQRKSTAEKKRFPSKKMMKVENG